MGKQFDWVKEWTNDPKFGYDARRGLSEYKDFIAGKRNKHLDRDPTDYEIKSFNDYEKDS